ncbi:MAG: DUF2807 domain-containing protein, partial [Treponema sp.]|nr:DUF2807 domain-containing protein [Treponema sp.]
MKRAFICLMGLFLLVSGLYAGGNRERDGETTGDDGKGASFERPLPPFSAIEISDHGWQNNRGREERIRVRVYASQEYRVVLYPGSNPEEDLEISNSDDTLVLRLVRQTAEVYGVDLYCPALSEITINSAADIEFVDKMTTPSLQIDFNGAGRIRGELDCGGFQANINGAGDIDISGSSDTAMVMLNGAGRFDGLRFEIQDGTFMVNGAGVIRCWAVDTLNAYISGVG